jgi:ABC-type Fe3+/spermidine/putrescine transport system ATPase subunit
MIELENISFVYPERATSWFRPGASVNRAGSFRLGTQTLAVARGERLGIIGPSGAGKSTLLGIVGGHLHPNTGVIRLDGEDISERGPGTRNVITVFQDHALFPNLTVAGNIEFPLIAKGTKDSDYSIAQQYMERFSIWQLRNKKPWELSGGEKQRTALARALVARPAVLLLDEPTASLDVQQKTELALLLNESKEWPSTPAIIMVTHDHEFALSLCDKLAILKDGELVAFGETRHVALSPPNAVAARVLDAHNVISGTVDSELVFSSDNRSLVLGLSSECSSWRNSRCAMLVPSDVISISGSGDSGAIVLPGIIRAVQFRGVYMRIIVDAVGNSFCVDLTRRAVDRLWLPKEKVSLSFAQKDIQIVPLEPIRRWNDQLISDPVTNCLVQAKGEHHELLAKS